jgi:hypothetical protein
MIASAGSLGLVEGLIGIDGLLADDATGKHQGDDSNGEFRGISREDDASTVQ